MLRLGFVGLGIMGRPMVKNLLKAGYQLVVYDLVPAAVQEMVVAGAASGSSPRDVASQTEIIITMLPNSPHVKQVVLGENGILEGAKPGSIIIEMSSIAPATTKEVAAAAAGRGVELVEAPVSGGEPKAIDGTLSIMVGGKPELLERCRPILEQMGKSVVWCGAIGAGNTTKLANQIIVALNIAAVSEALTLGAKAGVDPESIYHAIRGGLAGSTVLDAKAPMMLAGNFKPGFKIDLHIKDLVNAIDTGHELGVPLPLTAQVMEILQALKADGKGQSDHSAMVQYYEKLTGIEVRK